MPAFLLSTAAFGLWEALDATLLGDGAIHVVRLLRGVATAVAVAIVVVVLEARSRRRRERALLEAGRVLEGLMRSTPDAIVTTDPRGRLAYVSRAACEMLGRSEEDLLGRRATELYLRGPEEAAALARVLRESGGTVEDRAVALRRGDGSTVDAVLTIRVIEGAAGRPAGLLVIGRLAKEPTAVGPRGEDARSLAAIQELSASIAHEVRNPIAGIRGAIQVFCSDRDRSPRECAVLGEVLAQIHRLEGMVRDLIDFAQPVHVAPRPLRVFAEVDVALGLIRRTPAMAGVRVGVEIDPALEVLADENLLRKALHIVLENAAHAVAGRGTIVLGAYRDDGTVVLRIQDSGPGIEPARREDVFRPFFTTKHKGTGLGLAIARRILEAHGGTIRFECPASGGTSFLLGLPAVPVRRAEEGDRTRVPGRVLPVAS